MTVAMTAAPQMRARRGRVSALTRILGALLLASPALLLREWSTTVSFAAPKRPMSSYIIFGNENRAKYAKKDMAVTEVAKALGAAWKKLSAKDKKPYETKAAKDKARYEKEMATYEPTPEDLAEKAAKEARKEKRAKKVAKDPNAPKRPLSSYFIFGNENRAKYTKKDMAVTEVAKALGAAWKKLSAKDKKPYETKAAKDKARYEKEMATYEPTPEDLAEKAAKEARKEKRAKKVAKDPNAPKRPMSSYLIFGNENRATYTKKDMAVTEVMKALGAAWKKLSAKDKKPYETKAEKDKARYAKELAAYEPKQ